MRKEFSSSLCAEGWSCQAIRDFAHRAEYAILIQDESSFEPYVVNTLQFSGLGQVWEFLTFIFKYS